MMNVALKSEGENRGAGRNMEVTVKCPKASKPSDRRCFIV